MAISTKTLLIASIEANSGKSSTIIGLAHQLKEKGINISYGKPLGDDYGDQSNESLENIEFIAKSCQLSDKQIIKPLITFTESLVKKRLIGEDTTDYTKPLQQWSSKTNSADLLLLEGPKNLSSGSIFQLSAEEIAQALDAKILLVANYKELPESDSLLIAKKYLKDRLLGVLINNIPEAESENAQQILKPYLEKQEIPVFGMIPENDLMRSVSVREIAKRLKAKVLCRGDRLDLMVESLTIGAMNVNSALEYFRQGRNMVVITGAGRTDIQIAALETSTNCLILTGHTPPSKEVIARAEDLEVPILSVELDTLTTVEIVDQTFGQVPIQEAIKVQFIQELMSQHFDLKRLLEKLAIKPAVAV